MSDRGVKKWKPFNSVISNQEVINSLLKERSKIKKPIISESDKEILEAKIKEAFYEEINIMLFYYKGGFIYQEKGIIKRIDKVNKLITINNKRILFNQIISLKEE